jgi:hypothetical protein
MTCSGTRRLLQGVGLVPLFACVGTLAQPGLIRCASADLGQPRMTAHEIQEAGADPGPTLEELHGRDTEVDGGVAVTILAKGPILGSMNSREIETHRECRPDGIRLTATIVFSEGYRDAAAKNVLWRPRLELPLRLRRPALEVEVVWQARVATHPGTDQPVAAPSAVSAYPMFIRKTIR